MHIRQKKVVLYRKTCYNIYVCNVLMTLTVDDVTVTREKERERESFNRYEMYMHCKVIVIQITGNVCISVLTLVHRIWIAFFFFVI